MSNTKNDGGPVLPEVHKVKRPGSDKRRLERVPGMRLRDYFAQGFAQQIYATTTIAVTLPDGPVVQGGRHVFAQSAKQTAEQAYAFADAMLAAREA